MPVSSLVVVGVRGYGGSPGWKVDREPPIEPAPFPGIWQVIGQRRGRR